MTTASVCILITDILCAVARNAPKAFMREGEEASLLHTLTSVKEYLQKGNFVFIQGDLEKKIYC